MPADTDQPTLAVTRIALEELAPAIVSAFAEDACLIWSGEWQAYWRAGGNGYTKSADEAGWYTIAAAYARTKHCGPEKQIAFERTTHEPRPAGDLREGDGTAFGEVQCHCSDDDGVPDVGVSLGLGCAKAIWIGELLTRDGATCGMVFHNGTERIVAPFPDGTDWQAAADILRHHVAPVLASLRDLAALATHSPAPMAGEGAVKLLGDLERSATAVHRKGAVSGPQWSRLSGDLIRSRAFLAAHPSTQEGGK